MPRIFITSGTSFQLPADFNPSVNTVECYGGGQPGNYSTGVGGGGGSYAKVTNISIAPGAFVQIQIGSSGQTDTWFNGTSLANCVANGTTISCGAQGASGQTAGASGSSCGTTKNSGGAGGGAGNPGGGGGGGCGGPNGVGAAGGVPGLGYYDGSVAGYWGGGGGGANNGSAGGNGPSGVGGNNRSGGGGGSSGTYPSGTLNGGNGVNGGGGGGGAGSGGLGSVDNVYGDGYHGPGSGGGGGSGYTNGAVGNGANAGGYGGGGGGNGAYVNYGAVGVQTDGLIVITYTSAPIGGVRAGVAAKFLPLRAPSLFSALPIKQKLDQQTPYQNMSWWRQPLDRTPPPRFVWTEGHNSVQPWPNPTPLYKNPWELPQGLLWHPPTLDTRQQFPGLAPKDFHTNVSEDADVLSGTIQLSSYINASLNEYDNVSASIVPVPVTGSADDVIRRVKMLLPKGWWAYTAPIRDAIIGGIADGAAWCYSLFSWARLQSRVAWATGIFLDIISKDYFGTTFPRKTNEADADFRARIQKELIRERVTRAGMYSALEDLTGTPPVIFEPWNTGDTGVFDGAGIGYDIAGGWGDTILPAQSFINVTPPGAGIPGAPGWDCASLGWDIGGMWGDMSQITGTITNQDIYDTINKTRPTGSIAWTQLFPPAAPIPPSAEAPSLTPSFAPPGMIMPVVQPGPHRYSMKTTAHGWLKAPLP